MHACLGHLRLDPPPFLQNKAVVQIINGVLLPKVSNNVPTGPSNLLAAIMADPNLSTTLAALQASQLDKPTAQLNSSTIFAPTNQVTGAKGIARMLI